MTPLEDIKSKIPDYPGYADRDLRARSDEMVRGYAGRRLAQIAERLNGTLPQEVRDEYDASLVRCQFTNQSAFKTIVEAEGENFDSLVAADQALVDLADRADQVSAETLPGFLKDVAAALDGRDVAMDASQDAP